MDILPAIDLRDGKCVRLIQGQYEKQITYKDNPAAQAQEFFADGPRCLHIVDLDGAKAGRPVNTEAATQIAQSVSIKIELGGGIRSESSIRQMLDLGVERVILGTSVIHQFDWFCEMTHKFPGRLAPSLDARGGALATDGWLQQGKDNLLDFAKQAARLPIAAIIYTDISKDGMLGGPNLQRTEELVRTVSVPIVAAGGVTVVQDVLNLKQTGAAGAVIGRALYEGTITVSQALQAAQ
ncbi:MAG TPA: 1-(5-phosphoribosyl)-5-[(5-phosphoribosylamino)methylideneamino]imidazole-4-carboxamide isomerase [Anaerohalosphaeraceae bacterium]|nr:1-(5-phosphoribosyl)-5-[(5-phosphoribosylamino)methylideneamino]imidazole-4-carboxamide isomerase [Anaerohalosphaeraceae bacterium]